MDSVIVRLDIFAAEQSEKFGQSELASREVQVDEIPLGPAVRDRADFHAISLWSATGTPRRAQEGRAGDIDIQGS